MSVARTRLVPSLALTAWLTLILATRAEPPKPAAKSTPISYYRQIRPIFQQHCQGCHQPARARGGFVMIHYADLLHSGNSSKPAIVPGHPEKSHLVEQIVPHGKKRPAMPRGQDPLIGANVQLVQKWIAEGAHDDTPAAAQVIIDADHPPTYILPPVITSLDYSPDGKLLAVAGYHEVLLHHGDGSGLVARLVGLSDRVQSVAFSPDGKRLAVSGGDPGRFGEVQIWDVPHRKLALSVPVTFDTVYGVSWSPDGTRVAFGCGDNTLRVINARTGKQVLYQGAHNDFVLNTVWSTDGSHLVSVSRDRSMKLTEVATQRFIDNITSITPGALKGGLMSVARHPHRDDLLVGGADGVPKIYKMYRTQKRVIGDDFNRLQTFPGMPGRIFAVRYSPDGTRIVCGSSLDGRGEVLVYQASTGPHRKLAVLAALPGLNRGIIAPLLFAADMRTERQTCTFAGQKGAVYTVAFRPDGKMVASAGFDGMVRLNDPETGRLIKEFLPVTIRPALASTVSRK